MRIKKGFKLRTVGKEFIVAGEGVHQVDFNKLVSLNAPAAYLWQEVESKAFEIETLSELLVEKYAIDIEVALADAADIASQWLDAGLVEA